MKKKFQIFGTLLLLLTNIVSFGQDKQPNHYDFVGENHNKGLDKFFLDYSPARIRSENLNIEGLNSYISKQSFFSDPALVLKVLNNSVFINNRKTELADISSSLVNQGSISELCGSYISSINKIIDNDFDGNSLNAQVLELEKQIFNDQKLSEIEKEILLCATSTAKYSSTYWLTKLPTLSAEWVNDGQTAFMHDKYGEENSKIRLEHADLVEGYFENYLITNKIEDGDKDKMRTVFLYGCGKRLVKGDVAGAVSGAVGGALLGGVGAVAGGLGGALVGSVYEAVMCLLDWLF